MSTILVVDDEANIRDVVQYALEREGLRVLTARDGSEALGMLERGGIDLVVLDILMPEMDGLTLCRRIRERGNLPLVFLSSRAEEVDRILGLELGGDDYVTKPFSPRELATRVKAVLRRSQPAVTTRKPAQDDVITHGPVEMNLSRHEVRVAGERVTLTVTEFGVLQALLERPGHVLTRAQLVQRAYAHDNHVTERTMDTHIKRIRAKLQPLGCDPIETVHGLGYRAREVSG
ncbi:MAG: response regulator transcription factor [Myxococcota bacterium]